DEEVSPFEPMTDIRHPRSVLSGISSPSEASRFPIKHLGNDEAVSPFEPMTDIRHPRSVLSGISSPAEAKRFSIKHLKSDA
ncbi:hypothetical protein AB4348_02925, partial [Vibrio breoganii]